MNQHVIDALLHGQHNNLHQLLDRVIPSTVYQFHREEILRRLAREFDFQRS